MSITLASSHIVVTEAMKAGANNFAIKPFKPDTIIAKSKGTLKLAAA